MPAQSGTNRRTVIVLTALALLVILAAFARLAVGDGFGLSRNAIVMNLRIDRVLIAAIVGASLAVAGAVLQALLRNPLAEPWLLGVSTGSALGVMVAWTGWIVVMSEVSTSVAALIGAGVTLVAVYLLSQKRGRVDAVGLVLVGFIANAINGSAITAINLIDPHGVRGDFTLWSSGFLNDSSSRGMILIVGAVTLVGWALATAMGRQMDIATFSEAEAVSLGVNVPRLRLILFALAAVLTAGSVVLSGPIGFVGLICPHLVRLLIGPGHRGVVIGAGLSGALLILTADTAIRIVVDAANIGMLPVGVLTSLIGGPVFLLLLRSQLGRTVE